MHISLIHQWRVIWMSECEPSYDTSSCPSLISSVVCGIPAGHTPPAEETAGGEPQADNEVITAPDNGGWRVWLVWFLQAPVGPNQEPLWAEVTAQITAEIGPTLVSLVLEPLALLLESPDPEIPGLPLPPVPPPQPRLEGEPRPQEEMLPPVMGYPRRPPLTYMGCFIIIVRFRRFGVVAVLAVAAMI